MSRIVTVIISTCLLGIALWVVGPVVAFQSLLDFPPKIIVLFLCFLFANLFVVSFRFWRVLGLLGVEMPWRTALSASIGGNVAGLFVVPLVGQVVGRQAFLRKSGVPPIVNAGVAAFERVLLAILSGSLAVWGAFHLLGLERAFSLFRGEAVWQILVVACLGTGLSCWISGSGREKRLAGVIFTRRLFPGILEVGGITLLSQGLVLGCFVVGFTVIAPGVDPLRLLAAATIVSFCASLPVSIGGWGVREFAAVQVLGKLGVPASDAMIVSILIGVCSTLVLFGGLPFLRQSRKFLDVNVRTAPEPLLSELESSMSWLLGMTTVIAVFFQVHVKLPGGVLNLNLADPFAMFALISLLLRSIQTRQLPRWRADGFDLSVLAVSVVLLLGFFIGKSQIGVTQWALGGKLMGWLVLLGYCSAGALLSGTFGRHGLRRLVETAACVLCAVIVVQVLVRLMVSMGILEGSILVGSNFEGYSGNRNAFAFHCSLVLAAVIPYIRIYKLTSNTRLLFTYIFFLSVCLCSVVLSGSKAGIIVFFSVLCVAMLLSIIQKKHVAYVLLLGLTLWMLVYLFPCITEHLHAHFTSGELQGTTNAIQTNFSAEFSDAVRVDMASLAFGVWRDAPLFGAGLGVFLARSADVFGSPMVLHNTLLWILAELGLVGIAAFGWMFCTICRAAVRKWSGLPHQAGLLLILVGFTLFCQMHEVLYQRLMWLLLGAFLAQPAGTSRETSGSSV